MAMKHLASLPEDLHQECLDYGFDAVVGYERGRKPRSKACVVPGRAPIHDKPEEQARGRMFECAFCLWARLDPMRALNWKAYADAGFDVVLTGRRIDVKGSWRPGASALIWPLSKNHFFATSPADTFVFVRRARWDSEREFEIVGWITRREFAEIRQTAGAGHAKGFEPGTWYVERRFLKRMATLPGWGPPMIPGLV